MRIVAIDHGLDLAQSYGSSRTPGVHMSTLYNDYYKAIDPKRYGGVSKWGQPKELFELGMVFEEMLEEKLKERLVLASGSGRPGEFETPEGVICSPDLLIFNHVTRVGEIKLTFMSRKGVQWKPGKRYDGFPDKFDKYVTQMKLQCRAVGSRHARLYVFFVNEVAPWKDPRGALCAWDIEFSQHEIDEEWDLVWRHAKREGLLKGLK